MIKMPEDWSLISLDAITTDIGDGIHTTPTYSQFGDYYFINGNNIREGRVIVDDGTKSIDILEFKKHKKNLGDRTLLLSINGTIGNVALFRNEPVILGKSAAYLNIKDDLDLKYLFYSLQTNYVGTQFENGLTGTTIKNLGLGTIRHTKVVLPPTATEQRAIAEALSDVDGLLTALEALIVKKRAIKRATMQELLTGKTRLPGFNREWHVKRLRDHVTFLRNGVNSRAELTSDGPVKYLHYGDIHTRADVYLEPCNTLMPSLARNRAKTLERLQDGDLIFVDASEDVEGVGKSVEIKGIRDEEVVSGLHTIAARFDKAVLADGFKAYLQFYPAFRNQLRRLAAGTKVYATNRAHIADLELLLPSTDEQNAITTVLSDMDAEIAALEVRRDKTRAIKQGMMQQLLTGRIRLVKPEQSEVSA